MGKNIKVILPSGSEIICEVEYIHRNSNTISIKPENGFFPWDEFSDAEGLGKLISRLADKLTNFSEDRYFNIKLSPRTRSFVSMLAERDNIPLGEKVEQIIEQVSEDWYKKADKARRDE